MNSRGARIIFFGTPKFAEFILEKLIKTGYDIPAVFTQPDKRNGRKQITVNSPVKQLAIENGIKIYQPDNLRDASVVKNIKKLSPELAVVAAYGKILPKEVLEIPPFGCINIHASLLPKYRGASPIQKAILDGEKETGITLITMNEKMDGGDIIAQEKTEIKRSENAELLSARLASIGGNLLVRTIPLWIERKIEPKKQDEKIASYCHPIKKEDGKINWKQSAEEIYRRYLAFHPWPGIWTKIKDKNVSKRLKLLEIIIDSKEGGGEDFGKVIKYGKGAAVGTEEGIIILKRVQLEGKKKMGIAEYLRGNQNFIGSQLG